MSSIINYVADGSTSTFQIPFNFIDRAHVVVTVDGTTITPTFINDAQLSISPTPTSGLKITVKRETPVGALVDFTDGSTLFEADLDLAHKQNRFIAEESSDRADSAIDTLNANITNINTVATDTVAINTVSGSITNVNTVATNMAEVLLADTNAATATTKASEASVSATASEASKVISVTKAGEASASAASALASKNAAATSETNAAGSAATATTQVSLATTQASNSAASAVNAETAETNAQTAAGSALASTLTIQMLAQSATTKAAEAATSATNAATSETNAATSETNAATSATNAATSETNASTSATASSGSATASAASAVDSTNNGAAQVALAAAQVALAGTARTGAETAETNAAASETAAGTSETNAAASASTASTGATTATTKAGEASTSATNAATSATSAQASKDAALAALDSFDDRYLGQKSADPTVDNDGDALVSGALYFNTTDDIMKVYDGSLWVAAYASLSGAMFGANNLSDVADAAGSRSNLGLGTGNSPTFAGLTTTADVSFGDNDKAVFGAGADLAIYHNGADSWIANSTGNLNMQVTENSFFQILDPASNKLFRANDDGDVELYHNGSQKLATTTTGISVTGTVTADGLTVDGLSIGGIGGLEIEDPSASGYGAHFSFYDASSEVVIGGKTAGSTNKSLSIGRDSGDISFYEDTGTTPKFFWDASAESLGIGTSTTTGFDSGADDLIVGSGSASTGLTIFSGTTGYGSIHFADANSSPANYVGYVNYNHSTNSMQFATNSTERMRITSSGSVGIGVVPEAWSSLYGTKALQVGAQASLSDINGDLHLSSNAYYDATNARWEYINADYATKYTQVDGVHQWLTAASGTADAAITWSESMRISAGNLLVGQTTGTIFNSSSVTGLTAAGSGSLQVAGANATVIYANRQGSDGAILGLYKNGTSVGSIGTAGDTPYISAPSAGGVRFTYLNSTNAAMMPCNTTGANADATHDIGYTNVRFKDLYLSGKTYSQVIGDGEAGLLFNSGSQDGILPYNLTAGALDARGTTDIGASGFKFKDLHLSGTANAANFNTTSDATLKTNVETLTGSLDAVKSLRGVSYDWIESGGSEIGVIAQEVEAVLPDVVSTNDEGIKSVKYGNMVAVLIEAIKEQQLRIEALELKLGE